MRKQFRFQLQGYLNYRTLQTDKAKRALAAAGRVLEEARSELTKKKIALDKKEANLASFRSQQEEFQKRAATSSGDWSRSLQSAKLLVAAAFAERQAEYWPWSTANDKVANLTKDHTAAQRALLQRQQLQERLEAMRAAARKQFDKELEKVETEAATDAFSAIAWLRGRYEKPGVGA